MESIKDDVPPKAWTELSDQASGRAIDAYDFGVLVGLGKLVPDDYTITEDVVQGVSEALAALSQFVERMVNRA
jgi:hypothetical protein